MKLSYEDRRLKAQETRAIHDGLSSFDALLARYYSPSLHSKPKPAPRRRQQKIVEDARRVLGRLKRGRRELRGLLRRMEEGTEEAAEVRRLVGLVETRMDQGINLEADFKKTPFSAAALASATPLTVEERAHAAAFALLQSAIHTLDGQVERTEAKVERLIEGLNRGGAGPSAADDESGTDEAVRLMDLNDERGWHIEQLERALRRLDNGEVGAERVTEIEEELTVLLETNENEGFPSTVRDLYDSLGHSSAQSSPASNFPPLTPPDDRRLHGSRIVGEYEVYEYTVADEVAANAAAGGLVKGRAAEDVGGAFKSHRPGTSRPSAPIWRRLEREAADEARAHGIIYGKAGWDSSVPKGANPDFYKTVLCNKYTNPEGCSYGRKCHFAHGAGELRPRADLPWWEESLGPADSPSSGVEREGRAADKGVSRAFTGQVDLTLDADLAVGTTASPPGSLPDASAARPPADLQLPKSPALEGPAVVSALSAPAGTEEGCAPDGRRFPGCCLQ